MVNKHHGNLTPIHCIAAPIACGGLVTAQAVAGQMYHDPFVIILAAWLTNNQTFILLFFAPMVKLILPGAVNKTAPITKNVPDGFPI